MVIAQNDIGQIVPFKDDRLTGRDNPTRLVLRHIATGKDDVISTFTGSVDFSTWRIGMYRAQVIDNVTDTLITSFILQVIDKNAVNFPEFPYISNIGIN